MSQVATKISSSLIMAMSGSGRERRVIVEEAQDVVPAHVGHLQQRLVDAGLAIFGEHPPVGGRAKHRDLEAPRVASGGRGELVQALDRPLRREAGDRARDPAVAIFDDAPQGVVALAAQQNRRMRLLLRLRPRPDRVEIDHRAVEGGFLFRPQRLHRQDPLAHQLEAGGVAGAVVFHFLDVPAAADAEDEAPARQPVEAGDAFRGDDRVALGNETDAGAEHELLRRRGGKGQRDERVVGVRVAFRQFAAAGKRGAPADRNVGVFRHIERPEPALLEGAGEFGDVNAVIDREIEDANPHADSSAPDLSARMAEFGCQDHGEEGMPIAKIRGVDINYEILGERGAWVALQPGGRRGLVGVKSLGEKIAEAGFRVLVYDRRNCGASAVSFDGGESENEIWAEDLHALLGEIDALPAYIGGSSSGCRLALLTALHHPAAVRSLLLWRVTGGAYAAERLLYNYYTQYIELAEKRGMEAVCASEHWREVIANN